MVTGTKGVFKQQLLRLWNRTGKPAFVAAGPRFIELLVVLWTKHSDRLPKQVRDRLVRLRRLIPIVKRRRTLLGERIKKLLTYSLGVIAILLAILYGIYCG